MLNKMCMSVSEMAEQLGISKPKAYELAASKKFNVVKIGKRIIIPIAAFEAWLMNSTANVYKNSKGEII